MDSENGHAEQPEQAASAPRRYSLVTSSPGGEWFFAQQADGARIIRATNDSDIVSVTLEGVQDLAVASNVGSPTHYIGTVPTADVLSTLNDDPGKNAMLVCNEGENKLATPIALNYGEADGDAVTYFARLVPFNNGTWSRLDEGRALNASSTLSSFTAGDLVQFNSSCFLFIDGILDFLDSNFKGISERNPKSFIGGIVAPGLTGVVKAVQYVAGDEQRKEEVKEETKAVLAGDITAAYWLTFGRFMAPLVG
jgi:hypothetical protein